MPILFSATRDVEEAAGQEIEIVPESRFRDDRQDKVQDAVLSMVAVSGPTVFVPGYAIFA